RTFEIVPEDVGLARAKPETLRGGDANENASALRDVLKGTRGPFRDVAILNAAAALVVAGRAKDLKQGVTLATQSVDSGEANRPLGRLLAVANGWGRRWRTSSPRSKLISARRSQRQSVRCRSPRSRRKPRPPVRRAGSFVRSNASTPAATVR